MPKEQDQQFLNLMLTLANIKMKVKFPCKMTVEQNGRTLTPQVTPNVEHQFVFNQEIRLREEASKLCTELNICLLTQKGARYISGIAKLYHNQVLRSEGDRLVITLSKCLDPQAFMELRVDRVVKEGGKKHTALSAIPQINMKGSSPRYSDHLNQQPYTDFKSPQRYAGGYGASQTKSQAQFPIGNNIRLRRQEESFKSKQYAGMGLTNSKRLNNFSPKGRKTYQSKNKQLIGSDVSGQFQRQRMIQAQVYRDNYQKLKQKYLKQAETSKNEVSKRMALQNNENNYKLQIVRLKIRNQELEKALNQKNQRMRQLSNNLSGLHTIQSQTNLLRQDLNNKQHAIRIMQDTIITLSKQNDQLRNSNKDILFRSQEKIMLLQHENQTLIMQSNTQNHDYERSIAVLKENLAQKQNQIIRKNEIIQKEKQCVFELQKNIQNKLFQFDSLFQTERANNKQKYDELKLKFQQTSLQLTKTNNEKQDLLQEIDKYKSVLMKNQYQFKLHMQEIASMRAQIQQLKMIRDKYNEVSKEVRIIHEQKTIIQKNHEKTMTSKEAVLEQVTNQFKKQIEFQKKSNRQLQDKNRTLSSKLIQAQGQLEIARSSLQKTKRSYQNLMKEFTELKQKQKSLKKNLKIEEEELEQTKKQFSRNKEKNQTIIQSLKNQIAKVRQQLNKTNIQLQSQMIKNDQLMQTVSELNLQITRLRMSHQFSQQKSEKYSISVQQKYQQFQKIIKEHQNVIDLLEEKIRNQKNTEKQYLANLQKCDHQIGVIIDKNQKLQKELRSVQQKNKQSEIQLGVRHTESNENNKKIRQLEAKLGKTQQQMDRVKDNLQLTRNDLQKHKKINQIIQNDYDKAKNDLIVYNQKVNQRQRQLEQKNYQAKKTQQAMKTLQNKNNSLKKQYDKFKESVSEALNSSFSQIMQTFSNVQRQNNSSVNHSSFQDKKGFLDLNRDIVNAITNAGKDNKGIMNKLNDKLRSLERDIQLHRNESSSTQQQYKRQLSEKAFFIQQLQGQLRALSSEKGQSESQLHMQLEEMAQQLHHYQNQCNGLIAAKDELQYSLASLRMQAERLTQEYQATCAQLRHQKDQMQQKLQYQCHTAQLLQKKVHDTEYEMMNINSILMLQKEANFKKQTQLMQLAQEKDHLLLDLQNSKQKQKHLSQKYSELDLQFLTIRQIKQKYESMLSEQQTKLKDVRNFNNNILKEKEEIIKRQLQRNLEITKLQNEIIEIKHVLQQQLQSKNKYKEEMEQAREVGRKYNTQVKDLQAAIQSQKTKYQSTRDKLREKEQQVTTLKEEISAINKKNQENNIRSKKGMEDLKEQNDMINRQVETISSQSQQNIRSLQGQLVKINQQLTTSKEELGQLEQALFVERQNNQSMQDTIIKLNRQLDQYRQRLEQFQKLNEQLVGQTRQKDEHMYEMGGKIYQYENRMRELQQQKNRQIEDFTNSLNAKYDQDYQEIYQKIEFIQKQKEYFKQKLAEKQQELNRKNQDIKHKQIEEIQMKKIYQDKIKKLQEEKLQIFSDKNKQLNKALEQNKSQFENLRGKQAQNRKINHELQISRTTIQKLEGKVKQVQNDKNSQFKAYQVQVQTLRKKEISAKAYKDVVKGNQWNCQREVRKHIQLFIKKILEGGRKEVSNQNLISLIKGLEEGLLSAVTNITKE